MKKYFLMLFFFVPAVAQNWGEGNSFTNFLKRKSTITELSTVGTSFALDGLSTQAKFGYPFQLRFANGDESNPFLRNYRSRGVTAGYFAGAFGGYVAGSYFLRRHSKIRAGMTFGLLALESWDIRGNYEDAALGKKRYGLCLATPGAICSR